MRKILCRVFPLVLVLPLIFYMTINASAATLDPLSMGAEVTPSDTGYMLSLTPDPSLTYWERYLDGNLRYTGTGATYSGNSQERLLDNIDFRVYPFGQLQWMSCNGLTTDAAWHFEFSFKFQRNTTISQNFSIGLQAFLVICDSSGNEIQVYPGDVWTSTYETTDAERVRFPWDDDFDLDRNTQGWDGSDYFYIYYDVSFANIENENISTNVNFTLYSDVSMTLPVNSVYGDYVQSGQTNAYLDRIHTVLQENGQTLQDVLNEQNATNDHLDQMINGQLDPIKPPDNDNVSDALDEEHEITQDAFNGFQEFDGVQLTAIDVLVQYRLVLLAVSLFLNDLINLPFFYSLIYLGLALGVLAIILNITLSYGKSLSSKERKSRKGSGD